METPTPPQKDQIHYWQKPPDWTTQLETQDHTFTLTLKDNNGKRVGDAIYYLDDTHAPNSSPDTSIKVWKEHVDINQRHRGLGIATWLMRQADLSHQVKHSGLPRMFQDQTKKGFLAYRALASQVIYDDDHTCIFYP